MYYHYFNDEIKTESVNNLVEKLQEKEGDINLYFSTNGGCAAEMAFLISYFNSIKDRLTTTLTYEVWSAGTYILLDYKGKIKIDLEEMDSFLFHIADRRMYLSSKDRDHVDKKRMMKQDKEYNLKIAEKIKKKGLLNKKQLKDFINGKDVVIYKEQFSKWKL
jgi:hypothetical protein